ncbi:MAG: Fic family protein [Planctomycetes bacterium]|nr:Fic family protein [Planctomycetota bacterium]
MELDLFCSSSPGQIVPIEGNEHAFVPNPLPPLDWALNERLWPNITEAVRVIGVLDGIGRVLPNPAILLRPTEDREAIQSSALEGTFATPKELLLFEMSPPEPAADTEASNRFREVYNYRRAIQHATNSQLPISLRLIRELHELLMDGVRGHQKNPGKFRTIQVAIGTNRRFVPPPPQLVLGCLDALEKFIHAEIGLHPLVDCFLVHYQFETIHPFTDGNGRIGRLLLALMLQRAGQMSKPWMYLSDYFEQHREEYIQGLFRVSTDGDWESWVNLCLRATIAQGNATISRCERLLAVSHRYQQQLQATGGNVRLQMILDQMFIHPFAGVADVARRLDVSYPTAKSDLDKLAEVGVLKLLPQHSPKTYYAPEIFQIAYENISDNTEEGRG